jgi:hypothetical protein
VGGICHSLLEIDFRRQKTKQLPNIKATVREAATAPRRCAVRRRFARETGPDGAEWKLDARQLKPGAILGMFVASRQGAFGQRHRKTAFKLERLLTPAGVQKSIKEAIHETHKATEIPGKRPGADQWYHDVLRCA